MSTGDPGSEPISESTASGREDIEAVAADGGMAAYRALHTAAAVALVARDAIRVAGPDAESYLQGQCSQDVTGLPVRQSVESLLLSPQGKIEVYLRITREAGDRFVLDTDGGFGPAMMARLERFRLRTKVEFEPLDWVCAGVRGPTAAAGVTGQPELVLPVSWPGLEGVDLLGPPPGDGVDRWVSDAVTRCPAGVWEAARIEAGIPVNGREVNESTIAAEVGLVDRTVSFTKGCFTGQELVARLDARGSKVARHLWGVVIDGGRDDRIGGGARRSDTAATLVGSVVHTADGQHEVGLVTSAAWSPGFHRVVALATLHRRVEPPDDVLVAWERPGRATTKLPAEARPLPLVAT